MLKPALAALDIADPPESWRMLGFTVDDENRIHVGGVELRLGAAGHGITAWAVTNADGLELVPTTSPPEAIRSDRHPNGASGIDHVVITTPDFDAAARALEQAGLPFATRPPSHARDASGLSPARPGDHGGGRGPDHARARLLGGDDDRGRPRALARARRCAPR